ncbi:MAG: DNA polymerase II [Cellvibrionaceae bacterium]
MTEPIQTHQGFLLTRQWDDGLTASRLGSLRQLQLSFWLTTDQGPIKVLLEKQTSVFFLPEDQLADAQAVLDRQLGKSAGHPSVTPVWESKSLALKDFDHQPVVGLYFREQRTLYRARDALAKNGLTPLEADIQPTDRFLMERFITGPIEVSGEAESHNGVVTLKNAQLKPGDYSPRYSVVSVDIETSMTGDHLYSIGVVLRHTHSDLVEDWVFMIDETETLSTPDDQPYLEYVANEKQLMRRFLDWFQQTDPDIIIGWNVINFDLRFLQRKADSLSLRLNLGRGGERIDWRQSRNDDEHYTLVIPGRLVMDGIDTLKSATYSFESFALDSVAKEFLGRGKLTDDVDHRGETISEQFQQDKPSLAAYNLEDCQLVWEVFCKAQLIDFGIERARLTGLAMDRFGGSVAAFDNRYLPRLHRQGFVAPMLVDDPIGVGSPGGYVMDSIPGIYDHVLVLDFKSLYPSIIRTFKIDPLARILGFEQERKATGVERAPHWDREETLDVDTSDLAPGFNGAVFSKDRALLPDIINELWAARDEAKRQNNSAMSQAIKIIMNSFYGVLGTPGCRFFDYRLPSSITLRGHQILTRSKELIEEQGHRVIYGDTDSVFVCLNRDEAHNAKALDRVGQALAQSLNQWWCDYLMEHFQLDSYLEIEYETHYNRFVMPTIRGSDTGSKKRYAGLVLEEGKTPKVIFKGLEAVRTDWTLAARNFQRELYRRVFLNEPFEDFLVETVESIRNGEQDQNLVYRKRLRRPLDEYLRNIPPHAQAARKADEWLESQALPARYTRGGWVQYLLTVNGPEPLERLTSVLDYDLYVGRQIEPIADGILQFLDTSFAEITDQQIGLF